MSKANEALADVRRWLCDNLSDGEAGKACGMLSVVSRHVNELEAENAKLRELIGLYEYGATHDADPTESLEWSRRVNDMRRELGIEA